MTTAYVEGCTRALHKYAGIKHTARVMDALRKATNPTAGVAALQRAAGPLPSPDEVLAGVRGYHGTTRNAATHRPSWLPEGAAGHMSFPQGSVLPLRGEKAEALVDDLRDWPAGPQRDKTLREHAHKSMAVRTFPHERFSRDAISGRHEAPIPLSSLPFDPARVAYKGGLLAKDIPATDPAWVTGYPAVAGTYSAHQVLKGQPAKLRVFDVRNLPDAPWTPHLAESTMGKSNREVAQAVAASPMSKHPSVAGLDRAPFYERVTPYETVRQEPLQVYSVVPPTKPVERRNTIPRPGHKSIDLPGEAPEPVYVIPHSRKAR